MESKTSPGPSPPRGLAVVWTAPGVEIPGTLTRALSRGGLKVERAAGPYTTLARLCRLELSPPQAEAGRSVLVLVNPESLDAPGAMCDAVGLYAPHAACWMYTSSPESLRAVTPGDAVRWAPQPHTPSALPTAPPPPPAQPQPTPPRVTIKQQLRGVRTSRTTDPAATAPQTPKLRLTGDSVQATRPVADGETAGGPAMEPRPGSVLTPEELAMLLDDRDDQD
jgi:hypothetical protein